MKPQDVVKQLVGEVTGWNQASELMFVFYGCEKFDEGTVNIDFESGILEVVDPDDEGVLTSYSIKATLEPVTEE